MFVPKARSTNVGLLTLFTVASLLLVTAGPALAQQVVVGAGGGTGWEWSRQSEPSPDCLPVAGAISGTDIVLEHTGTFAAVDANGLTVALYVGPTTVRIDIDSHVISPAGVGPSCLLPVGPVPIDNAHIDSPPVGQVNGGVVDCDFTDGVYERVTSVVAFQLLPGSCTIKGNQEVITDDNGDPILLDLTFQVTNAPTLVNIAGTMNPCDIPVVPVGPFPIFVSNPECDLDPPPSSEPPDPSSHLVTTYEAVGAGA